MGNRKIRAKSKTALTSYAAAHDQLGNILETWNVYRHVAACPITGEQVTACWILERTPSSSLLEFQFSTVGDNEYRLSYESKQ